MKDKKVEALPQDTTLDLLSTPEASWYSRTTEAVVLANWQFVGIEDH
jgi:hypothetical protein